MAFNYLKPELFIIFTQLCVLYSCVVYSYTVYPLTFLHVFLLYIVWVKVLEKRRAVGWIAQVLIRILPLQFAEGFLLLNLWVPPFFSDSITLSARVIARTPEQTRALELERPAAGGIVPQIVVFKPRISSCPDLATSSIPSVRPHTKYLYHSMSCFFNNSLEEELFIHLCIQRLPWFRYYSFRILKESASFRTVRVQPFSHLIFLKL